MSNEKNCQITLYLDTPKLLLRPGLDKEYGSLIDGGIKDSTWLTGHAFIGLTDEKGKEQKWGFGPVGFDDDLIKYTTGCPSYFKDESARIITRPSFIPLRAGNTTPRRKKSKN